MKNLAKHIISYIMCINYWYDQNILPFFEKRASKKIFKKYKREERAILSIMLELKESGKEYQNDEALKIMYNDIQVKLKRFKDETFYTNKVMSVSGKLTK